MIPPQIQGWLLLHRARLRDQDIVGFMTMTGGSLNVKLVEKSLRDLFTDDVLQSVDRSHGKDSAFEAIEEIPEDDDEMQEIRNIHQSTPQSTARVGALMAHHPAWVSHHTNWSRSTTTVHPCSRKGGGCG